jgi:DNA polymerase III subunit gamma/tau
VSEVLYRKWRPQSFSEVVGQDAVTQTLRNSIVSGRLAHAYLFSGPRGTGKTTLGRLLAKAVNCTAPVDGEPCNACESCNAFNEGRALDFVEQDAASHNSVDDIRQLRENVILTPMSGGRKVYLLDEVHMLSTAADNALLKTLEEPPDHIIFVLATTEPHKVTPTIISRCQRFDLRRISNAAVITRLKHIAEAEGYTLDDASLEEIARSGGGSLRDAINGLEQVVTYYGTAPAYEQVQEALGLAMDSRAGDLAREVLAGNLGGALGLIAAVKADGTDMKQFCKQVTDFLRGLLLAKAGASESLDLPKEIAVEVKAQAASADHGAIVRALKAFGRADFRDDPQSSLPLELAVLELTPGVALPTERPVPAPTTAARPAATVPQPSAPKAEPSLSIPAAELDEVASTVASTSFETSEPPAEVAPAAVAARVTGGDNAGLLDQVRQACRETDKTLSALLNGSCDVTSVAEDHVVLGFYHTFHLERAESEPNSGRLAKLFSDALGRPVRIQFEHTPRERSATPVRGGHLVEAAKELGARPVSNGSSGEGEDYG